MKSEKNVTILNQDKNVSKPEPVKEIKNVTTPAIVPKETAQTEVDPEMSEADISTLMTEAIE